ncbi:hypothetical protein [Sphaerimonospora mesophila]|uniref:hypothetical protein n=1 Tax=Sphaerimonospora mesophila TaxID=37483 RepID=UPI00191113C6
MVAAAGVASVVLMVELPAVVMRLLVGRGWRRRGRDRPEEATCPAAFERAAPPPPIGRRLDVHPRVAMRILRHSQISLTMNVYTQIPSPATRKALDRLSQSLDGGG